MPGDKNDYSRSKEWDCLQTSHVLLPDAAKRPNNRANKPSSLNTSKLPCKTDKRVYQAISSIRDYQI